MIKQLWRVYTLLQTYLSLYLSIKLYIYKHIYLLSLYLSVALFVLFYIVYAYVCMCCQHIHAQYIYLYIPIYNIYSSMLSLLRYFALNNYKYNRIKLPLMCSRMQNSILTYCVHPPQAGQKTGRLLPIL